MRLNINLFIHLTVYLISIKSLSTVNYEESVISERIDSISKCDDRNLPKKKIVCYYRVEDEFRPYDADPCLCTHIIYSFVAIRDNFAFIAGKKGDLRFLSALKQQNPGLKVLISLRPSNNQFLLQEIERTNSTSLEVRTKFARRVREFVRRHGLDGVDLDWEYFKEAHNHISKRETLISLLNILSNELKPFNETSDENHSLLTITTSKYARDLADYYDFSEIYRAVDFVNVPAFNFEANPVSVSHPSKLHGISDMDNMDSIIDLILALGLPQDQLVMGVPAHGTLLKLLNASQTEPGSPASAWSKEEVIISHSKICGVRDSANWTLVREKDLTAPYIFNKERWIGFDDEISIKLKTKYIVLRQLSGVALWSLNDDDYSGKCGSGPFPLLHSIRSVFLQPVDNVNYNNSIEAISQSIPSADNSFVAVIEKYGNVERITDSGSEENSLSCPNSGYLRHPTDCTKFYRCVQFNKNDESPEIFQYSCPIGLVFDERYELCNWPSWSPPCQGSGEIEPSPRKKYVCPSYGYFQDPENCEYFYYCSDFGKMHLQPYQMKCPFDLAFDEEKLLCNWKWLVKGCGPVDPQDQVVRDLPQLLNQNVGIEPLAEESSDKFMERSDYADVGQSGSTSSGDISNQNSKPSNNQNGGSRFKKITAYMTKLMGDVTYRIKSIFGNTKIDSRSDRQGNRWLSRVNNYMPKFHKTRPYTDTNKQRLGKPIIPYLSDPLVSVPILELRPEMVSNGRNKGKQHSHRKPSSASNHAPKRHRFPGSHLPLTGLHGFNDDLFPISSITKTVQKIQEIIPLRNNKNRDRDISKDPMLGQSSNVKVTKLPLSSITSSTKPSKRPHKSSTLRNRLRGQFYFPTLAPLMIETMEELELPQYLPQQLSLAAFPGPKKSNNRHQHQTYLGDINSHKEFLHFRPEDLNLDKIKVERKTTPKPVTEEPKNKDKQMKQNGKNGNQLEVNFHNIDTKLLDTLRYNIPESDNKNDIQTIHLANNPGKEIKVNVNKDGQITVPQKQVPQKQETQSIRKPNVNHRNPEYNVQHLNRERQKGKDHNRLPFNAMNLGSSIHQLNQYLPDTEEILKQHHSKQVMQQVKPVGTNQAASPQLIRYKQEQMKNNFGPHQQINIRPQSNRQQPPIQPSPQIILDLPSIQEFDSKKIVGKDTLLPIQSQSVPIKNRVPVPSKQNFKQNEHNMGSNRYTENRYADGSVQRPVEQLDALASISDHFASYQLPNQRPTYDKFSANLNYAQNKNRVKENALGQRGPEKTNLLIVPVDDHMNVHKYSNMEKINQEYPKLFPESVIIDNKKEVTPEAKTTARPRIIFTAPSAVTPSSLPSLGDEYVMLMMNNDHNDHLLNNTERQKSIHELFKKTDGKLYNLETESSKTLVALVPKSPTTPKPILYESIPNMVSFNVTQPPVVIKFEIPRPKSHVFHSIVQKVRNDWLTVPYSHSYHTLAPYHVIKHDYQKQYPVHTSANGQAFIPITYHTPTTPSPIQHVYPNSDSQPVIPSIYESLQHIIDYNLKSHSSTPSTELTPEETITPMPTTTTTTAPSPTQSSSVILEHIPLYPTSNHTNGMAWPQSALPWYQQVLPPYPPVPVDPYQPMQPYPQIPPIAPNYPYYPMQSGYGYRSPPNMPPPIQSFQPQFLNPNLTANNWYDFYENEQRFSPSEEPTTSTTTTTTTTTTTSTTTPSTTTVIITPSTTQRSRPRQRPSFARRTSTTRRPKTTAEEVKVEVSTEQSSYDIQRDYSNKEKQNIEVYIVDDRNQRQPDLPEQTDVKVVYVDGNKEEVKPQYSNVNTKEDGQEKQETYGLRNGVKPTFKDQYQVQQERFELEHQIQPEEPKVETSPIYTDSFVPKVENNPHKDVEYEDEPEVGPVIKEEMKTTHAVSPPNPEFVHNQNPLPGVRNLTDNLIPESACTRPGLFQHPFDCNKYYECYWDKYINKFTLHSFECAVKLAFDSRIVGCGLPSDPTICVQY